jgi:hypothetical protein
MISWPAARSAASFSAIRLRRHDPARLALQDAGAGIDLEAAVDDHAARLQGVSIPRTVSCGSSALTVPMPVRIALRAGAPGVAVGACFGAGDPLALAAVQRRGAIQAGGRLQAHPGPSMKRMRWKKPIFSS